MKRHLMKPKEHFSTQASLHPPSHTALHKIPPLLTTPLTPPDMITSLLFVSYLNNLEPKYLRVVADPAP